MKETILRNFFKITFVLILLTLFAYIMFPFLISIILGGILAMALAPILDFFIRRGLSRKLSLILFSALLAIIGFVPAIGFFIRGARKLSERMHESNLSEFTAKLMTGMHRLIDYLNTIYDLDKEFVQKKIVEGVTLAGTFLAKTFSQFLGDLPFILMGGFITILSVYFFLRESDHIRNLFDRYCYFSKENGDRFVKTCKTCCREIFFANIMTGILQASIVSLGALIFQVGDFFLIFFITFVFSFIPVIGAAPVAVILALLSFMDAKIGAGIGLMVMAVIAGVADNVLRPFLGSFGEVSVHPFIRLLAVIGGVIMFGLPGLFIGPLIAMLIFGALPIIIEEYS